MNGTQTLPPNIRCKNIYFYLKNNVKFPVAIRCTRKAPCTVRTVAVVVRRRCLVAVAARQDGGRCYCNAPPDAPSMRGRRR